MRYRASLLLILLSLVLGGCAAETPGTLSVVEEFTNYKQIPGVTLAEITAIESLREAGKPFRLGMPEGEACFRRHDGVLDGYTVLLCEWLSELFDMNFIPAIYEWDRLLEGVRSHTIHFTGAITPLMAEGLYYTDPISERTVIIITRDGVSYLPAISRQRPLEYGFIEGTGVNLAVAAISGQSYNSNFYGTYKTAYEDLLNQEIDALLVDSDATAVFTALAGIVIEPLSPAIYHVASLGTANPDLAAIISVVQKYLRTDAGYKLSILQKQGHRLYARNVLYGMLDEGERRYWDLHQNPAAVIPIALSSDNYPISFFNQQMNEWQGISEDILHEIAEITGFTFGTVTSRNDNWSSTLEMLESGAAVLTGELIRTPAREGRFLWADSAYLTDFYALLSDSDLPEVNIGQVNHLRVGLVARTGYEELFHELFPDHPYTVVYGSSYEGFIGLAKGEVDLLMATRNLLLSATSYREMTGIKANLLLSRTYESLFGFNLQGDILCSIISKAQRLIDTDAISDYWIRRVFDYRGQLARAQVPYFIAASVLMVLLVALLGIFLIRNRQMGKRLEQTVNERTAELRHRTEELEVQTRAAEIASQTKSDFLSRMSHEIRTPLNAIIGMTWIAMNEAKEEKLSMALREISAASDHLLGILNDVLDMSKIEAGMFILAEAPFVLRTAMTEVSRIIEQRCMEKKITFADNTADMDDYGVVGDKLRLKQVLINLLANAVKFTPEEGHISFAIDTLSRDITNLTCKFTVSDSGIGMSENQISKLFRAFEQADESIATRFGGTGLGLAISQTLVGYMGGEITVESEVQRGSVFTFTLTFPLSSATEEVSQPLEQTSLDLRGKHLMVVDDVAINRTILTEILAETRAVIIEAGDGKEALDLFTAAPEFHFDLILMDIQMPLMNGYKATEAIRALARADATEVPIIAMTANAYREDVDRALASGLNDHLAKPVDILILMNTLRKYLCS